MLISSNVNVDEKNNFGQTLLHLAVFQQDNMQVARLMIDNNVNIHKKDNDGRTPAMSNALGRNCCKILWICEEHSWNI